MSIKNWLAMTKFKTGCALALTNFSFCQRSGPMVKHLPWNNHFHTSEACLKTSLKNLKTPSVPPIHGINSWFDRKLNYWKVNVECMVRGDAI